MSNDFSNTNGNVIEKPNKILPLKQSENDTNIENIQKLFSFKKK